MNAATQQLLAQALALPEAERADLAAELIGSLDAQVDDDAQQQWTKEIERRIAELDAGTVTTVPWTEIRRRLMGDGS
jgi:putative addiction module component (TIGR02574 family)